MKTSQEVFFSEEKKQKTFVSAVADSADARLNTPVSTLELERRWTAIRAAMAAAGIDVLLMQANNDFMGGYVKWFTDLPATQGYEVIVTFPADAGMTMIGQGPFGLERALPPGGTATHRGVDLVLTCPTYASAGYTHAYEADLTARVLAPYATGTTGTIGTIGRSTLSFDLIDRLAKGALSRARLVDASDLVDRIETIKSAEEIAGLRATAALQDAAMSAAFAAFRPGARDRDVTAAAEYESLRRGSEQGFYMCASTPVGTPAAFANRHYQNRQIQSGDQIALLVENSGPGGYFTELGRTAVLGRVTKAMRKELAFVIEARGLMLDRLRPGAEPAAIWTDYNAFMRAHGRPEEARLHCHGMGYDMVERPLIRFDEPMALAAGMVVACHPTYETASGLHWLCDDYLITEGAPERLHAFPEAITEIDG